MSKWEHLFYGEYAERRKILSGLTLEQVTEVPSGQLHSIFAELWHTVLWQNILVKRDEAMYEQVWQKGERYPQESPKRIEDWEALVEEFSQGIDLALAWTAGPEKLALEVDPGITMADVLHGLAIHNAYHMGKIVAIRQMMSVWQA